MSVSNNFENFPILGDGVLSTAFNCINCFLMLQQSVIFFEGIWLALSAPRLGWSPAAATAINAKKESTWGRGWLIPSPLYRANPPRADAEPLPWGRQI